MARKPTSTLSAGYVGNGVNFALFADTAHGMGLCLFDSPENETHRIRLSERTHNIWHIFIPGLKPRQLYGYRVHGPCEPRDGFRFDLATVLAREFDEVDKWGSFFDVIHQETVLSRVKLIAEPWELG